MPSLLKVATPAVPRATGTTNDEINGICRV